MLIHAGRGLPPGMPLELGHVAERHPDASLILAHAAIVAQAGIGELARSVENIFFDSSTWTPLDQLNLLSLVPPEQILWASDIPYGEPLAALNVFVRAARVSGAGDDAAARHAAATTRAACSRARRPASARRRSPTPEYPHARTRASAPACTWPRRRRCSGSGMPERVGFLGLAEAALREEGLDEQAELVRCDGARSGRSGRRRSCPERRPTSPAAGACSGCSTQAQADTVLA